MRNSLGGCPSNFTSPVEPVRNGPSSFAYSRSVSHMLRFGTSAQSSQTCSLVAVVSLVTSMTGTLVVVPTIAPDPATATSTTTTTSPVFAVFSSRDGSPYHLESFSQFRLNPSFLLVRFPPVFFRCGFGHTPDYTAVLYARVVHLYDFVVRSAHGASRETDRRGQALPVRAGVLSHHRARHRGGLRHQPGIHRLPLRFERSTAECGDDGDGRGVGRGARADATCRRRRGRRS